MLNYPIPPRFHRLNSRDYYFPIEAGGDSYQLVILSDVELHASTAESYRSSQRKGGSSFVADYTNLNQVETILPQGREVEESVAAAAAILFHNIQY